MGQGMTQSRCFCLCSERPQVPKLGGTTPNSLPSLQGGCWRHLVAASGGRLCAQLCLLAWIWRAKDGVGRWGLSDLAAWIPERRLLCSEIPMPPPTPLVQFCLVCVPAWQGGVVNTYGHKHNEMLTEHLRGASCCSWHGDTEVAQTSSLPLRSSQQRKGGGLVRQL